MNFTYGSLWKLEALTGLRNSDVFPDCVVFAFATFFGHFFLHTIVFHLVLLTIVTLHSLVSVVSNVGHSQEMYKK